jgi:hypothetical protein
MIETAKMEKSPENRKLDQKELKLNEEFGKMAEISEQSIVDKIKWKLSEMGYLIRFIENPTVNRYLQYYAKEIMNDFWNQIFDEEKIMELTKNLEREIELKRYRKLINNMRIT